MMKLETLRELASANTASLNALKDLAGRKRFRNDTNIDKRRNMLLAAGEQVIEEDYIDFFQRLEDKGAGKLVLGRGGKPNRFKWAYNLIDQAKQAVKNTPTKRSKEDQQQEGVSLMVVPKPAPSQEAAPLTSQPQEENNVLTPAKSAVKPSLNKRFDGLTISFKIPAHVRMEDVQALLQLVNEIGK